MVCFCTVNDYRTLYAFLLFTAFFPYRSTVLFPPAGWEKKKEKGRTGQASATSSFPLRVTAGARKRGWRPPALQRSRSPFPEVGGEGRRGDAPPGQQRVRAHRRCLRPRRGPGGLWGHPAAEDGVGGTAGVIAAPRPGQPRDGGMAGWMDEGWRDGKMEG